MKFHELTNEQANLFSNLLLLKKTAVRLWREGTPSTQLWRLVHNEYQIVFNDDLGSHDDFYNLNHPQNKKMLDLMSVLGFEYTQFGFVFPISNHNETKLNF